MKCFSLLVMVLLATIVRFSTCQNSQQINFQVISKIFNQLEVLSQKVEGLMNKIHQVESQVSSSCNGNVVSQVQHLITMTEEYIPVMQGTLDASKYEMETLLAEGYIPLMQGVLDASEKIWAEQIQGAIDVSKGDIEVTLNQLSQNINTIKDMDTRISSKIQDLDTRITSNIQDMDTRISSKIQDLDTRITSNIQGKRDDLEPMKDIVECRTGVHTCPHHARCSNIYGGFTCQCHLPYIWNGFTCEEPVCSPPSKQLAALGCIMPIDTKLNWIQARDNCNRHGFRLLEGLTTVTQLNQLKQHFEHILSFPTGHHNTWIGIRGAKWLDSSDLDVPSSFWHSGQPNEVDSCGFLAFQMDPVSLWDGECNSTRIFPSLCQLMAE